MKRKDLNSCVLRNYQQEIILTEEIEEKVYANQNFVSVDPIRH